MLSLSAIGVLDGLLSRSARHDIRFSEQGGDQQRRPSKGQSEGKSHTGCTIAVFLGVCRRTMFTRRVGGLRGTSLLELGQLL